MYRRLYNLVYKYLKGKKFVKIQLNSIGVNMGIKIGAFGYGIGAICAAGAILLAALGKTEWKTFAAIAVVLWVISTLVRIAK